MVLWMRKHGRTLKRDMEASLSAASGRSDWWAVFMLALVAVAREGSEAVVFLFGTWSAVRDSSPGMFALVVLLGAAAAIATYGVLQLGGRLLSWRLFFRATEVMLLCLAGALLVTAIENLVALEVLPELSGRLWDSSRLLPDSGRWGGLLAALTGYRARPHLTEMLTFALYWGAILLLPNGTRSRPRPA
ncbi:MAG: FTR1 family iron permease, partial [Hyphomicrobiaceae bacterium]